MQSQAKTPHTLYLPEHLDNAQVFEALYEEFIARARPLITDSARDDLFDSDDAHRCLDEADGFLTTIRDLLMSAHRRRSERTPPDIHLEPGNYWARPTIRLHAAE